MNFHEILEKIEEMIPFHQNWEEIEDEVNKAIHENSELKHVPFVPIVEFKDLIDTLMKLQDGMKQTDPAREGLNQNKYKIDGNKDTTAHEYLFGKNSESMVDFTSILNNLKSFLEMTTTLSLKKQYLDMLEKDKINLTSPHTPDPLTLLHLDSTDQWSLSWTTFGGIYERAKDEVLKSYSDSLEDQKVANDSFWKNIADYGLGYNLLILQKVNEEQKNTLKKTFQDVWDTEEMENLYQDGLLYFIDLRIFNEFPTTTMDGVQRFTPSTITILKQDHESKDLVPIAISVSGNDSKEKTIYTNSSPAWLYSLQAAKTSVTVFGIWLGHVYQWHMITAAMMRMLKCMKSDHPIRMLLDPHSKFVSSFTNVMLLHWQEIVPPTSFSNPKQFLRLQSKFAEGRSYFDDDPEEKLRKFGIKKEDFTISEDWDKYPIARQSIQIWKSIKEYVTIFVNTYYEDDHDVNKDPGIQKWIEDCKNPGKGNIRGLSAKNKKELINVLTSLLYRVIAHGSARMLSASHPLAMFVGNFPPCLTNDDIPTRELSTKELLSYMPTTGTIAVMIKFYYIFAFVKPYRPLIPAYGVTSELYFPTKGDDGKGKKVNDALIKLRKDMMNFIDSYSNVSTPGQVQRYQWAENVET